jgi:cytoskeletal protein CcmA (bactofilin family)
MWKKGESEETAARPAMPSPVGSPAPKITRRKDAATIGPSITIKGDVTGSEDLVIEGRVDGTITLKQNHVTVGAEGRVKASIVGRTVTVEGQVEGDLCGEEQIVLRKSARVQGNISAPRVTLEDGAVFRGGIDMQEATGKEVAPTTETEKAGAGRAKLSATPQRSAALKPSDT